MNDFFRSKTFKIIAVLLAAVLAFFLRAVYTGGLMPALSHIGGAVATPFGEFFLRHRSWAGGFLVVVYSYHRGFHHLIRLKSYFFPVDPRKKSDSVRTASD